MTPPAPIEIRQARISFGLTQHQAAKIVGYSQRGWQEAEAGRRLMPAGVWMLFNARIAALTGDDAGAVTLLLDGH